MNTGRVRTKEGGRKERNSERRGMDEGDKGGGLEKGT